MKSSWCAVWLVSLSAFAWSSVSAQTLSIDEYKLAGGGGTSAAGTISISGTISQPEAGGPMSGGTFLLTSGSWSFNATVQTSGAPNLIVTHAGSNVVLSWPDSGNFFLQQNPGLGPDNWTVLTNPVVLSDGTNSVRVVPANGVFYFRLKQ